MGGVGWRGGKPKGGKPIPVLSLRGVSLSLRGGKEAG